MKHRIPLLSLLPAALLLFACSEQAPPPVQQAESPAEEAVEVAAAPAIPKYSAAAFFETTSYGLPGWRGVAFSPDGLIRWAYHSWYPAGWSRMPPPELAGQLRANGWLLLIGWGGALAVGQAIATRRLPNMALLGVLAILVVDLWRVDARYCWRILRRNSRTILRTSSLMSSLGLLSSGVSCSSSLP